MGWERMKSIEETKRERIRGFMPFVEGATVTGTLHDAHIKPDGKGFFVVRLTSPAIVNVQDEESKTGQGKAQVGELVGIRKTGATKVLRDLDKGTLISVTYDHFGERLGINPETRIEENNPYHYISIDVYKPENERVVA